MITRIWADLIDLWLALGRAAPAARAVPRPGANVWRALPGDLVGLAVMRLCGGLRPTREVPRADGPPALLVEDPRAGRYLDNVPLKPYAQTLGRYILAARTAARHDRAPRAGARRPVDAPRTPVPAGLRRGSFLAILAGRNRYFDNIFEIAARAREPETGRRTLAMSAPATSRAAGRLPAHQRRHVIPGSTA